MRPKENEGQDGQVKILLYQVPLQLDLSHRIWQTEAL